MFYYQCRYVLLTGRRGSYLVPAEVVDEDHAEEDGEQAEALEGQNGQAESAILLRHTGGVVLAVGAALLAGQAVVGRPLVGVWATFCSCSCFPGGKKNRRKNKSLISVRLCLENCSSEVSEC